MRKQRGKLGAQSMKNLLNSMKKRGTKPIIYWFAGGKKLLKPS